MRKNETAGQDPAQRPLVRVSVRQMVEFICRSGDLEIGTAMNPERALEGTRVHQKLQRSRPSSYRSEVALQADRPFDSFILRVEGRADGIDSDPLRIEEIKSTYLSEDKLSFSVNPLHRAQLLCYGAIYCEKEQAEQISLRLTYYQMESGKDYSFDEEWSAQELSVFFEETVSEYALWVRFEQEHRKQRKNWLQHLEFPFAAYRKGQYTMAGLVYRAVRDKKMTFLQAPTGIGKTISTLFPSLKAMGEELTSRIFYLTAKNATAKVAIDTLVRLGKEASADPQAGYPLLSVIITAKDKLCPRSEEGCVRKGCPYAQGYYDRINAAVWKLLHETQQIDREVLLQTAEAEMVCPYELALEVSSWSDVIIGDYNYAFDPTASLRRFFGENETDYTLLVDEAHNLPDRAREMFSVVLTSGEFSALARHVKGRDHTAVRIRKKAGALREALCALLEESEIRTFANLSSSVVLPASELGTLLGEYLENVSEEDDLLLQTWFHLQFFEKMAECFDPDAVVVYADRLEEEVRYHLFCVHPGQHLKSVYEKVRSVILFSATLLPIEYYRELLGGTDGETQAYALPSSFDPARKGVFLVRGLRTDYQARRETVRHVAGVIFRTYQARPGRYLVFFPSYAYLELAETFLRDAYPDIPLWKQHSGMDAEEKSAFLSHFENESENGIGLAVLGGMFAEGIDLRGDKLIGSIIVTVGLPQIGIERDLIRDHMERLGYPGFDYAYRFPGLGKVFQAAGRVIRTEEDRGVIVLIDERFGQERTRRYFPPDWQVTETDPQKLSGDLAAFWKEVN